jgi:hypothetical protein
MSIARNSPKRQCRPEPQRFVRPKPKLYAHGELAPDGRRYCQRCDVFWGDHECYHGIRGSNP